MYRFGFILGLLMLSGCASQPAIRSMTPVYGQYTGCGPYKFSDPRCNATMLTAGGGGN